MITINQYLDEIFADFKSYVNCGDPLCMFRKLQYNNDCTPDYSNKHIQQYYLLRYAYAYAYEYMKMYQELLHIIGSQKSLSILSIGCGSMIDYWSLVNLLPYERRTFGIDVGKINYCGVDRIDWDYKIKPSRERSGIPFNNVRFVQRDICAYLEEQKCLTADVYVFPKSISEFNFQQIYSMAGQLVAKVPNDKTIFILASYRYHDISLDYDQRRLYALYDQLVSKGFQTEDKFETYSDPGVEQYDYIDDALNRIIGNVRYPGEIKNYLNCLHEHCPSMCGTSEENKDQCRKQLDRSPIMRCKYARWKILKFRKEAAL